MCCSACCLAEFDSSERIIRDKDGLEVFLLPWPGPKTETALQKLPVNEAVPKVEPRRVPTVVEIGLLEAGSGPLLAVGRATGGAPRMSRQE